MERKIFSGLRRVHKADTRDCLHGYISTEDDVGGIQVLLILLGAVVVEEMRRLDGENGLKSLTWESRSGLFKCES